MEAISTTAARFWRQAGVAPRLSNGDGADVTDSDKALASARAVFWNDSQTRKRTMTTRTREEIRTEIAELLTIEVCVGHNEGTYGAAEACRKCGSGDPRFANRHEYETVGGEKRSTGPDLDQMPGRMLYGGKARLAEYRQQLASLRAELRSAR